MFPTSFTVLYNLRLEVWFYHATGQLLSVLTVACNMLKKHTLCSVRCEIAMSINWLIEVSLLKTLIIILSEAPLWVWLILSLITVSSATGPNSEKKGSNSSSFMSFGICIRIRSEEKWTDETMYQMIKDSSLIVKLAWPTKSLTKSASSSMKLSLRSVGRSPDADDVRTSLIFVRTVDKSRALLDAENIG